MIEPGTRGGKNVDTLTEMDREIGRIEVALGIRPARGRPLKHKIILTIVVTTFSLIFIHGVLNALLR